MVPISPFVYYLREISLINLAEDVVAIVEHIEAGRRDTQIFSHDGPSRQ
jgi:hypothetical protein